MHLLKVRLLASSAVLMVSLASIAAAHGQPAPAPPASAQPGGFPYDMQQLPAIKGTVAHYSLTPRGDIDGLILTDGTEVSVPPHLSTELAFSIKPGDLITARGLKAYSIPMIAAVAITNEVSGVTVFDRGPGGPGKGPGQEQPMSARGRVQAALHGPRGELNGAMLEDGTVLRLPPPEATRYAALLAPGETISAEGNGIQTPMGNLIEVTAIGQAGTPLSDLPAPPPPPDGHPRPPGPPRT